MKQPQLPGYPAAATRIGAIAASLEAEGSTVIPENFPLGSGLYDDVELRDIGAGQPQKVRCCRTDLACWAYWRHQKLILERGSTRRGFIVHSTPAVSMSSCVQQIKQKWTTSDEAITRHGDDLLPEQDEGSRRIWMRLDGLVPYKVHLTGTSCNSAYKRLQSSMIGGLLELPWSPGSLHWLWSRPHVLLLVLMHS